MLERILLEWYITRRLVNALVFVFLDAVEAIFLGFQHYVLALGSIVLIPSMLVPEMGGSDVSF